MRKLMRQSAEWICLIASYLVFYPMMSFGSLFRKDMPSKKEILILSNDLLGDAISRLPFFAALRKEFPASTHRICVLVNRSYEELYRSMPYFDEVISVKTTFDRHPIIWLLNWDLNWATTKRNVDILISCLKESSLWQSFLHRMLQPQTATGPCRNRKFSNPGISTDCRYLSLPRIGQSLIADFNSVLKFIKPGASDLHRLKAEETSFLVRPIDRFELSKPYIAVVPGAGTRYRRWPIERFSRVLIAISKEFPSLSVVVLGSNKEHVLGEQIRQTLPGGVQNLCGKTSFFELGGILRDAKIVLTNETGSATFSAVLGAPTVCILGGGDFGTYFPNSDFYPNTISVYNNEPCFGCVWRCSRDDLKCLAPCIDSISEASVLSAMKSILTCDANHSTNNPL